MHKILPRLFLFPIAFVALTNCISQKTEEPAIASAPPAAYPTDNASASPPAPNQPSSKVQTTYSGLKYEVVRAGTGRRPTSYNRVKVHYHGTLLNGQVFDSTKGKGPVTFGLGRVIPGWQEGIPLMREGAIYRFTIPPNLAYGSQSMPGIPANSTLQFEVELLEVVY